MTEHLISQGSALYQGISAFEPYINELHKRYESEDFIDWPTIVLATTLQTTCISLFKLLPAREFGNEPLDKRSIASIVRNVVDTHDVIDMLINEKDSERFNLHRDIMGLYLSSRINKVQSAILPDQAQEIYKHTKQWYWKRIKGSELYEKSMDRLKSGEALFYQSRRQRLSNACGKHADFVSGVLADLSTYVHSIPPSIWMSDTSNMCSDNESNRNTVAVWLRISNFYFAQSMKAVVDFSAMETSEAMAEFMAHHEYVFSE